MLAGNGICGRQIVPGYGSLEGPLIWKGGIIGWLIFGGTVPKPRLM
jgi:hypothetical protein